MLPTRFSVPALLLVGVLWGAGGFSMPATAAQVSATNLFLAPSLIPDAYYPVNSFTFGTNTTITDTITATQIGGTLTGVEILPVLDPDPNSTTGDYTPGDLAAINSSNFMSYFFRQPGTDYTADLTSSQIAINYMASGQYLVKVDATGTGGAFSDIFQDNVDDFTANDPANGVKDKGGVTRKITNPSADLVLVSSGDPDDNGFLKNANAQLTNAGVPFTNVNSIAAVKTAIQNAFNANGGKKITVVLMGHGFGPGNGVAQGGIKIGNDYITNFPAGTKNGGIVMTPTAFQMMIDQWTNNVSFWSCYTGGDPQFLQQIANSVGTSSGFSTTVSAAAPSLFGLFSGYFDQGALGKKGSAGAPAVPEPSAFALLALGLLPAGHLARKRKTSA